MRRCSKSFMRTTRHRKRGRGRSSTKAGGSIHRIGPFDTQADAKQAAINAQAEGEYDIDHQVWDLALADHVRRALESLQPGERAAVELAYFGGMTYREVAAALGEAEGTVKSRIRSGLRRLRAELSAAGVSVGDS